MAAARLDAFALKNIYMTLQKKIQETLQLAQEDVDPSDKRSKLELLEFAKTLVDTVFEAEEKIASTLPAQSEAAVHKEIQRLRKELEEKNELIRDIRAKLDQWTRDCEVDEKIG